VLGDCGSDGFSGFPLARRPPYAVYG